MIEVIAVVIGYCTTDTALSKHVKALFSLKLCQSEKSPLDCWLPVAEGTDV